MPGLELSAEHYLIPFDSSDVAELRGSLTSTDLPTRSFTLAVSPDGNLRIDALTPHFVTELEHVFFSLAQQWRRDTKHVSNLNKAFAHPAYQQIIGMGKALPFEMIKLLLQQLEHTADHWLFALVEISGQDPALGQDTFLGAVDCWLTWGRREGYLANARSSA